MHRSRLANITHHPIPNIKRCADYESERDVEMALEISDVTRVFKQGQDICRSDIFHHVFAFALSGGDCAFVCWCATF